ncbi:MAG: hypothetical protein RLZZ115_1806 [Cyanobacteriota bacterium]|jgi:hypothetical protein|nr:hypothetical protein NO108_04596 [Planktothrix rubescens]CAH2574042.1 hypothetical protein PRNO82_03461 [Planktothrix rubescens]
MGIGFFAPLPPKFGGRSESFRVKSPPVLGDLGGNHKNYGFQVKRGLVQFYRKFGFQTRSLTRAAF